MQSASRIATSLSFVLAGAFLLAGAMTAHAQDAASLSARHLALRDRLASNPIGRPVYLESVERPGEIEGDIYAVVNEAYGVAGPALGRLDTWCDILILHLNVKSCHTTSPPVGHMMTLRIGRKFDQPLADAYPFEFVYKAVATTPGYLHAALNAERGPFGTSHYRIALEIMALDEGRSFVHLAYAYAYGTKARLATLGYLATIGRDKVGFSITRTRPDGKPEYIRGMRGIVERNTMRYFVAIEAYLGALAAPASAQLEMRLNAWYDGIERYPVQLHELERDQYLDMKRREISRQLAEEHTGLQVSVSK